MDAALLGGFLFASIEGKVLYTREYYTREYIRKKRPVIEYFGCFFQGILMLLDIYRRPWG